MIASVARSTKSTMAPVPNPKSGTWILFSLLGLIAASSIGYLLIHHFAPLLEKSFGMYCY